MNPPQLQQVIVLGPGNLLGQTAATSASADKPDNRSQSFQPVKGGSEMQSGAALLVEAYSVFWLCVLGLLWVSMRRIRSLDQRISRLSEEVSKARHEADAADAADAAASKRKEARDE